MLTLKIIANSPTEALDTIAKLIPNRKILAIRVDKLYRLDYGEVYTVKIDYD